jgi:alpha-L-rhamnosidase
MLLTMLLAQAAAAAELSKTASVKPLDLRCEYLADPAGIDEKEPRLSWRLLPTDGDAYDQRQTAYQVLVSGDPETLGKDQGGLWDSGQVASGQTTQVEYRGQPLTSRLACFWKVRVKDEQGVWSGWSAPARWTMGLLEPSDWTGQWIGGDQFAERLPHQIWKRNQTTKNPIVDPWLRRSFVLDEQPRRAVIYVASVGYHELYVNGKRIGDDVLSPPVTDLRKRVGYVVYDISGELRQGKNVIGLWLGPGWCLFPYNKTADKPQTPMVLAQAEIALPGGKQVRVVTDGSWKMHPSPNMLLGWWENRRFGGEKYDARQEIPDWNRPACDDGSWKAATVYTPKLTLSAAMVEPNRCVEVMTPVSVREKEPGVWVADFGKVFTGMLVCEVSGEPGASVDFLMSEIEGREHTFSYWSQYIIGPGGKGTFQNRFNFFVGRWVTVKGLKAAPKPGDLRAWRVRPAYETAAQFECSSPLLNDIWRTSLWTFENLTVGGYIGGDMSRERVGATFGMGDFRSGLWSYRLGAFFTKWLTDFRDAQYPNGLLPSGAPFNSDTGGEPTAPFSAANMPWGVYGHCADLRLLERNHVILTSWLDYIGKQAKDNVIARYHTNPWKFLGDWVAPGMPMDFKDSKGVAYADMPETQFFVNCFHVYTLRTAARQAAALGRAEEAARYGRQAEEVAAAVHKHFFKPDENSYVNGGQAYLAIALAAGVPPKELDAAVMKRLEDQIVINDKGRLNAGQLGLTFLFEVLHQRGRDDLVLRMMNTREYPGWGHMLSKGATTWWEDFEGHTGQLCFSYLHPPFWLMQAVAGLNPDPEAPGFKRFVVKPGITGDPALTWAKCSYESEWGTIHTGWRRESGRFQLDVTVPPNTTATVYVPAGGKASVNETRHAIGPSGAARWLRDEAGFVVFDVQPGRYRFVGDGATK